MKIIKINPFAPLVDQLMMVAEVIKAGGIIGYPTETVYGLGADPFNPAAVNKIFRLKGREKNKPILLIAENIDQVKQLTAEYPRAAETLASAFWPGPLTLVFRASPELPVEIIGVNRTIGIRIPDHKMCLELIKISGVPITSTSANISGNKNPTSAEEVAANFGDQLDLIIDGGQTKSEIPSTVISVDQENVRLLRQGAISKTEIEKILRKSIYE